MKQRYFNAGMCAIAAIGFATLVGCNDSRCPVRGTVTVDGVAVEKGTISFEPADGQGPTTGATIVDGKYELVGNAAPLAGKKTVRISGTRKTGRMIQAEFAAPGTMIEERIQCVPAKTELSCEVVASGQKDIDFALKSK